MRRTLSLCGLAAAAVVTLALTGSSASARPAADDWPPVKDGGAPVQLRAIDGDQPQDPGDRRLSGPWRS